MSTSRSPALRKRTLLAGLLAASAIVLSLLNLASEKAQQRREMSSDRSDAVAAMDAAVDSLLQEFHVDPRSVRTRQIRIEGNDAIRQERHVHVSPDFVSLEFNRTLGRVMERYGAHVIATERSREGKVLLHILYRGTIVRTLVLTYEP
jgi:hypothetical protein